MGIIILNISPFQLEVLEMLAQCGADLNVRNKDDETPSGENMRKGCGTESTVIRLEQNNHEYEIEL